MVDIKKCREAIAYLHRIEPNTTYCAERKENRDLLGEAIRELEKQQELNRDLVAGLIHIKQVLQESEIKSLMIQYPIAFIDGLIEKAKGIE